MKKLSYIKIIAALGILTNSCNTDFDNDVSDTKIIQGEADFTRYVALGNSLTSGYRDGALYLDGQNESYPLIIAKQMQLAGGANVFEQPLMPDNIGGFSDLGINGKLALKNINGSLSPVPSTATSPFSILPAKAYQNLGVPGAKSYHLTAAGYGNSSGIAGFTASPYFARFATSATTSVLEDAVAQNPTFFSLWIGNNDVLGYATSGGDGSDPITPYSTFQAAYTKLVQELTKNGAKGIVATLPSVEDAPFFTTVPSQPFVAGRLSPEQINQLNAAYSDYNAGIEQAKSLGAITAEEAAQRKIVFVEGKTNGAVIIDKDLTNLSGSGIPSLRMTSSKDLLVLSASSVLSSGGGTSTALADKYVLTEKEKQNVITATEQFNALIKQLANTYNLAFFDASAKMKELNSNSGLIFDGVKYNTKFISGGAFSLDGIHLTGRGYAIIANEFIKTINNKYKSNLPQVNTNKYSGITFP